MGKLKTSEGILLTLDLESFIQKVSVRFMAWTAVLFGIDLFETAVLMVIGLTLEAQIVTSGLSGSQEKDGEVKQERCVKVKYGGTF